MRPEARRAAAAWMALLAATGSFAASVPAPGEAAPAADTGPISEALCGRQGGPGVAARALDSLDPALLPAVWRRSKLADLELWLKAPVCRAATSVEFARYTRRHETHERIRSRIEQARRGEILKAALAGARSWQSVPDTWSSHLDCPACAALRSAAAHVAEVAAARWPGPPPADDARIGPWLDAAARSEPLIAALCAAKPPPGAQAEIETRFRYFTWTAGGATLSHVAALFERPEVVAACQAR